MSNPKLNIKQWSEEDRPREKLLEKGPEALSDAELLAILMGSGNRDETAVDLAKRILLSVGNDLNELGRCSVNQLISDYKGVGEAKAITIIAAAELGRRRTRFDSENRRVVRSSAEAYRVIYADLADKPHEEIWIILLNSGSKVIAKKRIGQGGVEQTTADIRIILKEVVLHLASKLILCHNHPSGSLLPSAADDRLTLRLANLLRELGATLADHLIITDSSYFSYADQGRLDNA